MTERLVALGRPLYASHRRYPASVEPLFGGMLWGVMWTRARAKGACIYIHTYVHICVTYRIVRGCRGENTHLHTSYVYQPLGWETRDTRVTILKRRCYGARAYIRFYGELYGGLESRVLRLRSLTVGCLFAWPAASTGSFTGRLLKLELRPASSISRKRGRKGDVNAWDIGRNEIYERCDKPGYEY